MRLDQPILPEQSPYCSHSRDRGITELCRRSRRRLTIAGDQASDEHIDAVRKLYGFDRPVIAQYTGWLQRALRSDFGERYHYQAPVVEMISGRIGTTMTLGFLAILFSLAAVWFGFMLGATVLILILLCALLAPLSPPHGTDAAGWLGTLNG